MIEMLLIIASIIGSTVVVGFAGFVLIAKAVNDWTDLY